MLLILFKIYFWQVTYKMFTFIFYRPLIVFIIWMLVISIALRRNSARLKRVWELKKVSVFCILFTSPGTVFYGVLTVIYELNDFIHSGHTGSHFITNVTHCLSQYIIHNLVSWHLEFFRCCFNVLLFERNKNVRLF